MAAQLINATQQIYTTDVLACQNGPSDILTVSQDLWYDDANGITSQLFTANTLAPGEEYTPLSAGWLHYRTDAGNTADGALEVDANGVVISVTDCTVVPDPTPTPSPTDEPTPTPSPTDEPTPTPSPTDEPTPTPSPSPTATPTATPTPTPTPTPDNPPVANDGSFTVGSEMVYPINIHSLISDDLTTDANLSFSVTSGPSLGSVGTYNSSTGIIQYTAPQVAYGSPNATDSFTYQIIDSAGQSASGTITITVTAAQNTGPIVDSGNSDNSISIPLNGGSEVVSIYASDNEQAGPLGFTISTQPTKGTATISVGMQGTDTVCQLEYALNPGQVGSDVIVLTIDDGEGATTTWTINVTITLPNYITANATAFSDDSESVCLDQATQSVYVSTSQALSVNDLAIGDTIFSNTSLSSPYGSTDTARWIKIEGQGSTKLLELNESGRIQSSQLCGVEADLARSTSVQYSGSTTIICGDDGEIVSVWFSGNDAASGTPLATLIGNSINLFSSEYWANLYANGLNPDLEGLIPAGLYAELTSNSQYYKRSTEGTWVTSQGSITWDCPEPITYDYYQLTDIGVAQSATQICNGGQIPLTTLWYAVPQVNGSSTQKSLLEIVQQNIPVYQSEEGVQGELIEDLWPSSIFSENGWYAVWDNEGDGIGFEWFAFRFEGDWNALKFVEGSIANTLGNCASYIKPEITLDEYLEWNSGVNDTNVYYAFMACSPKQETDNETGTLSYYWQMYVVDAMYDIDHVINPDGSHNHAPLGESPLKDLVEHINGLNLTKPTIAPQNGECLEYAHTIYAEDINDAVDVLKNWGYESDQYENIELLSVNPEDLGLGSEQEVSIFDNCFECIENNPIDSWTIPYSDEFAIRAFGPNFDTETNYKLDNVAKPLLRTNPKLTTNVKLVVNSQDQLYLESIDATKELAAVEYKKFPISADGQYAYDVARFYNVNMTPTEMMYATKKSHSDLTVLDSYDKQVEETYQYGTKYNFSKLHSENFRLLAPIWLDVNMPKKFVIFRVNDPVGSLNLQDTAIDNFTRIQELLKNAEIIKTFDLSRTSNLGKYLRNHVQSETFPSAPITMSFEQNEKTTYNGIDLIKGGFTSKGEYVYKDLILSDKPLIEANDFITTGFKRNEIASANIINLEFMFDDDMIEDYSVNRYFGLYVDDIDSGRGRVSKIDGKTHEFKELISYVDPKNPTTAIPSYKQVSTMPLLAYASVADKFFRISSNTEYDVTKKKVAIEDRSGEISSHLGIQDSGKSVDLIKNEAHGYDFIKLDVVDVPNTNDSLCVTTIKEEANKFTFVKHTSGQTVEINLFDGVAINVLSFVTGATIQDTFSTIKTTVENGLFNQYVSFDNDDKSFFLTEKEANLGELSMSLISSGTCIVKNERIQTSVDLQNHTYFAEYSIDAGKFNGLRFSNQGSLTEIAVALAACINHNEKSFRAYNVGATVYIVSQVPGYKLMQSALLLGVNNVVEFLELPNRDYSNELGLKEVSTNGTAILERYDAYYLSGGNSAGKSILVNNETISEIAIGDYIETRYKGVYNKVVDIVQDIDSTQYTKVILEETNDLANGEAKVFYENEIRFGLFSAYNLYDMNFDFYDKSNSDLKELMYETREQIQYEPYEHVINNIDATTNTETTILGTRDIFGEDFDLEPIQYFSNLSKILSEEAVEDSEFEQIESEYDRLKENQLKEFATTSRTVPNINKWVLKDAITVREQPYYLNINEAFGRTNFSPDLTVTSRDHEAMTHEWFYIEKLPKYLRYDQINDTFSYINFIEGFELTPSMFKSAKYDYFNKFMVSDGFEKTLTEEDFVSVFDDVDQGDVELTALEGSINSFIKTNILKKYSLIKGGNDVSFASTIFKGIKVNFKNRKEFVNTTATEFVKGNDFNGYKFSIMLKVNENAATNSVDYEVIQNKKFKFVIMFITLNLGDYWIDGNMNRKLLYELNHKIVYDTNDNDYIYANTDFDGSLRFNDTSINWSNEGPYTIEGSTHVNGSEPNFDSQITIGNDGLFGDIYINFYPNMANGPIYKVSVVAVDSASTIKVSGKPVNVSDQTDILNVEFLPNSIQNQAEYTYVGGGANAHKVILEELTAKNVADMLNLNNDQVKYTTVDVDGSILDNRFVINFNDGSEIIKKASLNIEEDTDKPKSYKLFKGNIGYNLIQDTEYFPFLIRHGGNYTVDLKPVVTFTDMYTHFKVDRIQSSTNDNETQFEQDLYKHSLTDVSEINRAKAYYKKYNRCGTVFNLGFIKDAGKHDADWGVIKNHFYHKVNEINPTGVTKLSTTSDKLPLYQLIGEIAIDKKDINVFRSSWDSDYYTRSLAGGESVSIPGTFETREERSYLASTVMKPKDAYTLLNYTWSSVTSEEELDDILRSGANTTDVVLYENETYVVADFYISDVLTKYLAADGVLDTIAKYVEPSNSAANKETLDDDAEMYVRFNLIDTYILDNIKLYTKRFKGDTSKIVSVNSIDQLESDGFTVDQNNYAYRRHAQKPMNFRLIYNKRLGYSYDIKPMIKIKS